MWVEEYAEWISLWNTRTSKSIILVLNNLLLKPKAQTCDKLLFCVKVLHWRRIRVYLAKSQHRDLWICKQIITFALIVYARE